MGLASNTVPPQTDHRSSPEPAASRLNPVALEAVVTVTGARPSSEGTRDLFTEETRTILVFVDGAVMQLTSPVNEGQLLFLTNKKSNEEVVCQVLHKRALGASTSYVELQFTEEKPNYWGVSFPKGSRQGAEFTVAAEIAAGQTAERNAGTAPPDEKDVNELKWQVEGLRRQLAELEKKNAERSVAHEQMATGPALRGTEESKASVPNAKTETSGKPDAVSASPGEPLLMPAAGQLKKVAPGWTVPMALPTQGRAGQHGANEDEAETLPRPELDFSRVPHTASPEEIAARASLRSGGGWGDKWRALGLMVLLAAAGLGAYQKLAPYVASLITKPSSTGNTAKPGAPQLVAAPSVATTRVTTAGAAVTGDTAGMHAPAAKTSGRGTNRTLATKQDGADDTRRPSSRELSQRAVIKPAKEAAREASSGVLERATKTSRGRENIIEKAAAEVVAADSPVNPAKLLRASAPLYPPDAMRSYITGDVKAELVVEASGQVGEVKVISGPKALRDAAIDALKKYQYAPATRGGKSVPSTATEVVKFWFNP